MDEKNDAFPMNAYVRKKYANLDDNARNNSLTIIGYLIYAIVILGCYFVEVIKGSRTIGYYAIVFALTVLPLGVMYYFYRMDHSGEIIRYILSYGYLPSYLFIIFTTNSLMPFIYGVVLALLIMIYADTNLCRNYVIILVMVNIVSVIVEGLTGNITSDNFPDYEIRVGFVLVYAVFLVLATAAMKKNNNSKMEHIASEKDSATKMLTNIMEISENMIGDVEVVSEKMRVLSDSVAKTKVSMEEVSNGTIDTAQSVQKQLSMTEEIQNVVEQVVGVSGVIEDDMEAATMEVAVGKGKIDELIGQVHISDQASGQVSKELGCLTDYASKMQSIVELIENISVELDKVVDVVNYLMDNNKLQSVVATETASSFETIATRTEDIQKRTQQLTGLVTKLSTSNSSIVDSVQTISAATEEVTAHSNMTLECSEENNKIVEEVNDIVGELQVLAERLQTLEEQ